MYKTIIIWIEISLLIWVDGYYTNHATYHPPPDISVSLRNKGFHREIVYHVHLQEDPEYPEGCNYTIKQVIPPAMYVNVDELNHLKRQHKLNVSCPEFVDIELTTESASSIDVYIYFQPGLNQYFVLPVHYRYHKPDVMGAINVQLSRPQIYIQCTQQIGDITPNPLDMAETFPSNKWVLLKSRISQKTSLKAKIPRGRRSNYFWVFCGAIALSWVSMMYLITTIVQIPKRLKLVSATNLRIK